MTLPTPAQTAEALEKSILHWRKNVEAETPVDAHTSAEDCDAILKALETRE